MLRIIFFLALGVVVGGAALEIATGDPAFAWIWPAALPVAIISGVLTLVARQARQIMPAPPQESAEAMASGRAALAVVTAIRRTGTMINDVPVCELTLVVAPRDRDAYETSVKRLVDPVEMPRFQPGEVKVVGRYALDRPEVWIIDEPDTTWRNAADEGADSLPLTAPRWHAPKDAPPLGRQPLLSTDRRTLPVRVALYALAVLVGAGAVIAPNFEQFTTTAGAMFTGEHPEDFTRGDRQQVAVDALVAIAGPKFTSLRFFDGFVLATAPTSPGATTLDEFQYRWFEAERQGPATIQEDDVNGLLFDVSEVDVTRIQGIVEAAMRATGIAEPDTLSVSVEREPPLDSSDGPGGPVRLMVNVSDAYYSGWYTTDAQGAVTDMRGGRPGSDAYVAEHADD